MRPKIKNLIAQIVC